MLKNNDLEEKKLFISNNKSYVNETIKKEFLNDFKNLNSYSTGNQIILKDIYFFKKYKEKLFCIPHLVLGIILINNPENRIKTDTIFSNCFIIKKFRKSEINIDKKNYKFIFIFQLGSIIFWNFNQNEETLILSKLGIKKKCFSENEYLDKNKYENNQKVFIKNVIKNDLIFLTSFQREEKLCISFVLAISIKLEEFENSIDNIIENMEFDSKFKFKNILLNFKNKKHTKRLASLFLLKAKLFLNINNIQENFLLKITDKFLDEYKYMLSYFNISGRKKIIFKKYSNLMEILSEISNEKIKTLDFNLYYLFIFWISIAIVLLFVQDLIEYIKFRQLSQNKKFHGGIIQKIIEKFYLMVRNRLLNIFN